MVDLPVITHSAELFKEPVVARFHEFYRKSNPEGPLGPPWVLYKGYVALKFPTDLWLYQEILSKDYISCIIENGTAGGGTTLYLADLCEAIGRGHVISTDLDINDTLPKHDLIKYNRGDTLNQITVDNAVQDIYRYPTMGHRMLILDDGHSPEHVEKELELWTPILASGDWLIVEDTDLGGPYWALREFMRTQPDGAWERQVWCDKFSLTQNPMGYWRRK